MVTSPNSNRTPSYFKYWAKVDRFSESVQKPYHLLPYHLLDVAACLEELLRRSAGAIEHLSTLLNLDPATALPTLTWLVGLHDVGKFSESFQNLQPEVFHRLTGGRSRRPYIDRHDALGRFLLEELFFAPDTKDWLDFGPELTGRRGPTFIKPLIEAIAGHHGKPALRPDDLDARGRFEAHDIEAFAAFAADLHYLLGVKPRWIADKRTLTQSFKHGSWALAGWAVLADWLGSNEEFFPFEEEEMPLEVYLARAREQAKEAVERSGVIAPPVSLYKDHRTLFPHFNSLSPLQDYAAKVALAEGPQLFILEDATGAGKTEAALILAMRLVNQGLANGLYIGLPTMATANGIYERMRDAYQAFFDDTQFASLILAHSARHISESFQNSIRWTPRDASAGESYDGGREATSSAVCAAWLSDSRKKSLLAPFGVGTIDQALLATLPAKHQSLRLIGLSQKVLIIDEVHAYDAYINGLLENLLRYHASQGGSAILLSATIPQNLRQRLCDVFREGLGLSAQDLNSQAYPLATHCAQEISETDIKAHASQALLAGHTLREQKSHDVQVQLEPGQELCIQALLDIANQGGCACWIRNTVQDALDAYDLLKTKVSEDKLTLFHARFTLSDRARIEEYILRSFGKESTPEERAGKIVIATQVIEQSLDLDFDFMVTDLAPIDLIIQRAGRMHRHDHRPRYASPTLLVHGPHPTDDAKTSWYGEHFERAQWVYKDQGQLWLTAKILRAEGRIQIPENARQLIEFVYSGANDDSIPEALQDSHFDAFAEEAADESMAQFNALDFEKGYSEGASGRWFEDIRTPTRLGDPSIILRLARFIDTDQLQPWSDDSKNAWTLSEVSIRASYLDRIAPGAAPSALLTAAQESMRDKGKWSHLVPLRLVDADQNSWQCPIVDHKEKPCLLTYSPTRGLHILSEEL